MEIYKLLRFKNKALLATSLIIKRYLSQGNLYESPDRSP